MVSNVASVIYDPFDPPTHEDPDAAFAQLREACPVHFNAEREFFTVADSGAITGILNDPATWSSRFRNGLSYHAPAAAPMLLDADPPIHSWQRRLLQKAWTPQLINALEPRVRQVVDALMDGVEAARSCDFHEAIAGPVPTLIIAEFIGVPDAHREQFRRWSDARVAGTAGMPGHEEAYAQASRAIDDYFIEHIADRRALIARGTAPDDFTTMVLTTEDAGRHLDDAEVGQVLALVLLGGIETTTMHLSNLLHRVVTEAGLAQRLRDDPGLLGIAVEESMRVDSPTLGLFRTPNTEQSVCDRVIPADAKTMVLFAAVNRDPKIWPHPDEFRLDREPSRLFRHFGFGHGIHRCLGAPLARLEGRIVLERIVTRWPGVHYTHPPRRTETMIFRGFVEQPVAW